MGDAMTIVDALSEPVTCGNQTCKVASTGKCVEGLELDACSFYGKIADPAESKASATDHTEDGIKLAAGTILPIATADLNSLETTSRVLAIIGPKDSGKSSLIASLYDLFQEGDIKGIGFARSAVLPGLEELCHDARAASRRAVPHFERTPHGEVRFYHLEVIDPATVEPARIGLFLGDRAGEEYRSACDDPTLALSFPEIRRADCLTILVDGERLLHTGDRHNLQSQISLIIQAIIESDAMPFNLPLALVLTKLDVVRQSDKAAKAEADFASFSKQLSELYGDRFTNIAEFRVAASPKTTQLERGTGIQDLLRFWLDATPDVAQVKIFEPQESRAFCRLTFVQSDGGQA